MNFFSLPSGAFFINTVLRTLLRVSRKPDVFGLMKLRIGCLLSKAQLPILICSTHGKDRVGVISLLILSILGAHHDNLVSVEYNFFDFVF